MSETNLSNPPCTDNRNKINASTFRYNFRFFNPLPRQPLFGQRGGGANDGSRLVRVLSYIVLNSAPWWGEGDIVLQPPWSSLNTRLNRRLSD